MKTDIRNPYDIKTVRFPDGSTVDSLFEVARLIGAREKFGDLRCMIRGQWAGGFWKATRLTFYILTASGATLASVPIKRTPGEGNRVLFEPMERYE